LLYSSGASKFVVHLLAPLGCLPIARQEFKTGNNCYEKLNDLAKQHNAKIGPILNEMAETKPDFQFTVFDFYNVILRRTQRNMNYRELQFAIQSSTLSLISLYAFTLKQTFNNTCCYD